MILNSKQFFSRAPNTQGKQRRNTGQAETHRKGWFSGNMSRLNATIKLLFACGELLFLFASLFCVLTSGIVASGHLPAFAFPLAKKTSIMILLVSTSALICSCFGCCAVLRQQKRRGCFSGRRMLVSSIEITS